MARRHILTARAAAAAPLGACAGGRPHAAGSPIRVGIYAAPLSLDPRLESEFLTCVLANTFEGLTGLDADLRVVPALAASRETHDVYVVRREVAGTPRLDGRVLAADLGREP